MEDNTETTNNTDTPLNITEQVDDGISKSMEDFALALQASMAFIGFIGNICTYIILTKRSSLFGETTLRFIKNQAVADAVVCFLGSIFVLQPPMWKTGWNNTLDMLICQVRPI